MAERYLVQHNTSDESPNNGYEFTAKQFAEFLANLKLERDGDAVRIERSDTR